MLVPKNGWAAGGGSLPSPKFLGTFGAAGAIAGISAEAYNQGDLYSALTPQGAMAGAIGAGAALGSMWAFKNKSALKQSLFSGAEGVKNAWKNRSSTKNAYDIMNGEIESIDII